MPLRPLLALLALAATWGASYLFIAVALQTTTPSAITLARSLLAAVLVGLLAARRGSLSALRGRWRAVAGLAVVQQAGPMLLIAVGEQRIPSGLAGTLVAVTPLWGALLAPALGRPAPSAVGWTGLAVGLAGVGLLLGADPSEGGLLGSALVLLAALGYALGAAWTARGFAGLPREALLAGVLTASSVLLVPAVLVDVPTRLPDLPGALSLAALGLLGTGAAYLVMYWLIGEVGPERTLLVTYLAPVFAVGYGALLLDERLGVAGLVGLVLVVTGAWLAARRPRTALAGVPVPEAVPTGRG